MSESLLPGSLPPDPERGEGDDASPRSSLPPGGVPGPVVVVGFAILAVGLFVALESHRKQSTGPLGGHEESQTALAPEIPRLDIPPPPPPPAPAPQQPASPPPVPVIRYIERPAPPPPPPVIQYVDRPIPPVPQPPAAMLGRLSEPALVIDTTDIGSPQGQPVDESAAHATVLRNRASLVPQGTLIPAVLETPIDSTRPGPVRALTSTDTRGFDGVRILIPKGSRLVGDYHSEVQQGQSRVLVTWNRLVRPDGVAIRLVSPATDPLGGTGIAGDVNNHTLARVGSVVLQTVLTIGVNLASRPGNGSVVIGSPAQAVAGGGQTLLPAADLKPTITVREGATISIFVVRDLDFTGTGQRP